MNEILTVEEVAELLRVTPGWVHEKCRQRSRNPLPCFRPGKYLRFSREEVLAWLRSTSNIKKGEEVMTKKERAAKKGVELSPAGRRLLTVAAAAQYLSTTVWQMRTLEWERRIPTIKLGRRLLFDRADLDRFIENQKTPEAAR
jgi:excisionase family DNA binding protein